VSARVEPFIDDMAGAYGWADLVVCRSGALTVAELAAAGLAAVLVPFPGAVDDHQTRNGAYLVDQGAAVLVPQTQFTPQRLAEELGRYAGERSLALAGAVRARALARPGAAVEIADLCQRIAEAA
jgi:UDP-N-acetylglucosamine--N-acetylmuramyl-(pentapeptide) pyrophosphoryl-undecaprenol N-acetylglucosamine transferase